MDYNSLIVEGHLRRKRTMPFAPKKSKPKAAKEGFLGTDIPAVSMVIYGPEGVGKTSFAGNFEETGFITDPKEQRIRLLAKRGMVPQPNFIETVETHAENLKLVKDIARGSAGFKCRTLVQDSLTGFENMCFRHHCDKQFGGDFSKDGFFAFQAGPKAASKTDWCDWLDALQSCVDAGISVICIGHAQVKTFNNPDGPDYDKYIPYVDKDCWQQIHRWVDTTLFYNFHNEVKKDKPRSKAKGSSDESARYIHTVATSLFSAKNCFGLPAEIDAGSTGKEAFENFKSAFLS